MNRWSLVALGLLAVVGCQRKATTDVTCPLLPADQATLTGATVSRIPIPPPPPMEELDFGAAPSQPATSSPAIARAPTDESVDVVLATPAPPRPPPMAAPRTTPAPAFPETSFGPTNADSETSFGSTNAETGEAFPESSFGDYDTPAPGAAGRALDAGFSLPYPNDIPR